MTIKQHGGIFGRNPTFNDVDVEGDISVSGNVSLPADSVSGNAIDDGTVTPAAITVDDGSSGSPSIAFTDDADTGIYRPAANNVAISTGGTDAVYVDENQRVGIGASDPLGPLHIIGDVYQGDSGSTRFVRLVKNDVALTVGSASTILTLTSGGRTDCIVKVTFAVRNGFSSSTGSIDVGTFFFGFLNFGNVNAQATAITGLQQAEIQVTRAIGTTFSTNALDANTIELQATASGYGSTQYGQFVFEVLGANALPTIT